MPVDRGRQRATKRRIKRARLFRRHRGWLLWAALAVVPLLIGLLYLNHYVLTRDEVTITVDRTRVDAAQNQTRYRVVDQGGKSYWLGGGGRVQLYKDLEPGARYRCRERGVDLEIPFFWDWASEITECRRL